MGKKTTAAAIEKRLQEARMEELGAVLDSFGEQIVPFNTALADGFLHRSKLLGAGYTDEDIGQMIHYGDFYPYIYEVLDGRLTPMLVNLGASIGVRGMAKRVIAPPKGADGDDEAGQSDGEAPAELGGAPAESTD
jgi:hypothetical protein